LIIKLGDRFNPLEGIVLTGLVQGCDLSSHPSSNYLRARIWNDQTQLAHAARSPPFTHSLHSLRCFHQLALM
jgi:hypothetical protein